MSGEPSFDSLASGTLSEDEEYWDSIYPDAELLASQLASTQLDGSDEAPMESLGTQNGTRVPWLGQGRSQSPSYTVPADLYEVAHSPDHQNAFDEQGVSWAVQWELARYLTTYPNFTWDHISMRAIPELCGPCAEKAPVLADMLLKGDRLFDEYYKRERFFRQSAQASPWEELDREEILIRDGLQGTSIKDYGGKIQQRMRLHVSKSGDSLSFDFILEQPTKSKSCRFSRFLGSRRLIECHISKQDLRRNKEEILNFFIKKKLLIHGRLFQAFFAQPGRVALMEINQDFQRSPLPELEDSNRMSLPDLIAWHNNLHLNSNQKLNKWASRFGLGFSTSQSGLVFRPENIHFLEDTYVRGTNKATAVPHEIMTDGCGFMNYAALKAVQDNMGWSRFPTCIQARIAGSKGLFMLEPEHRDPSEDPQIWLRTSQVKIKLNHKKEEWSPTHYILDVVSCPHAPESSSITYEMILSLSDNGVPDNVLANMLQDTIAQDAQSLEPSSKAHGSQILYDSIYTTQRVLQSRLRQVISPDAHRAQALLEFEEEDDDDDQAMSAKWDAGPDPSSGQPASSQEQVLGWLQAGFLPTDKFVMEKLIYLQDKMMTALVKKYRISVPESVRAFIVPDPLGVLDENEVFFAPSQPVQTSRFGLTQCITGPVLVSRNPCIQSSDTRKVVAVDSYELWSRGYRDIIVFSTKGSRSLASLLSGGDYDGDTVIMIWNEVLTGHFTNADTKFADPGPEFEERNFKKSNVVLRDIKARAELNKQDISPILLEALLQNIAPSQLGIYNIFYRCSVYLNGLKHPETVRLGHMFTQTLDSGKSGLVVKDDVERADRRAWGKKPPACFPSKYDDDESNGHKPPLEPRKISKRFILEVLQDIAIEETERYKTKLGQMRDRCATSYRVDQDLARPFDEAEARVQHPCFQQFQHERQAIKDHVTAFRVHFSEARSGRGNYAAKVQRGKHSKGRQSIGEGQESTRAVSEDYSCKMPRGLVMFSDAEVRRIAASYAYKIDFGGKVAFCFAVAWAELCAIKAQASGGAFATLMPGFIESMAVHRKMAKVFREMEADEDRLD